MSDPTQGQSASDARTQQIKDKLVANYHMTPQEANDRLSVQAATSRVAELAGGGARADNASAADRKTISDTNKRLQTTQQDQDARQDRINKALGQESLRKTYQKYGG